MDTDRHPELEKGPTLKLNGITLGGYSARGDEATFSLSGTTIEEAAALDGETLTVTDEGETVEVFEGYVLASVAVSGESVRVRAIRRVEESAEAAIRALEENVRIVRETATATQAVANEAREVAQTGTPAMRQAMQLAISSSDLAPEDYAGFADLYDAFDPEVKYKKGRMVTYEGGVYRCTKNTASTIGTTPDVDSEHWERVDVTADGVEVWGPEKSYNKGDRVHYPTEADPVYVSQKNNNTVEPGTNEKYWTKEE